MGIPKVQSCCCGCTLKTGSNIIGSFDLVVSIIALISYSVMGSALNSLSDSKDVDQDALHTVYGVTITMAVFCAFQLLFAFFLLFGVNKVRPSYMKPWMIFCIILAIVTFIVNMINASSYFSMNKSSEGIGSIIGTLIYVALRLYYYIVVNSLHTEYIENPSQTPQNY